MKKQYKAISLQTGEEVVGYLTTLGHRSFIELPNSKQWTELIPIDINSVVEIVK